MDFGIPYIFGQILGIWTDKHGTFKGQQRWDTTQDGYGSITGSNGFNPTEGTWINFSGIWYQSHQAA